MNENLSLTANERAEIHSLVKEIIGQTDQSAREKIQMLLQEELPDLSSAQAAGLAERFLAESAAFCARVDGAVSVEDAQEQLRQEIASQVAEMNTEEAVSYLVSLQYAAEMTGAEETTVEEATREIRRRMGEDISPERVERLAAEIVESRSVENLIAIGYGQMAEALPEGDVFLRTADAVAASAEQRAVLSAALYARARNDQLNQIGTALSPSVATAYANASVESMVVTARLASGGMGKEQVEERLSIVGSVVKWVLSTAILTAAAGLAGAFVAGVAAEVAAAAAFGGVIAHAMGIFTCFGVVFTLGDFVEDQVDYFCDTAVHALRSVGRWINKLVKGGKNKICVSTQ